ncbi:hypothetical protein SF1_18800 [Sphingobacterium faecium NBRC 15299]|uniref:DUF3945 domain-containing protein n=1 Tax=Sphingobacterium faecium TaxID=34087 RepID=UPI000D339B64|nr:DUF3945 domain-containing protein [Sphingobacterium faecium]PTX09480.1 uncharacterized protein DUF3945 [Sphingobacterium faecium]GEM63898.1 hypothetical protein SF1_18800 [Sphingobacterium faecium NBRC 15299]
MSQEKTINQERPEELTDILLVLDKEKKKIQAVKGLDEKGNMETVNANKSNIGNFMKVDRQGNLFSNFWKNFVSEIKNPTNFSFFKIPSPIAIDVAKELQKQVKNPTPEGEKLMQQYELKVDTPKEQVKTDNPKDQIKTEIPKENIDVSSQTPKQESKKDGNKYKVEDIDWDTMNNLGLSKEYLLQKKLLEPLLKGYKTNVLVPVSLNLGGAALRTHARIWLQPAEDGKPIAAFQGVRKEPELKYPFFGHKFTEEDKKNLLETGNMGRVVNLTNTKNGEIIPSIVSIDRLTNELVALRTTKMVIPEKIKGVKLEDWQKQTLMEGKPIYLEGMTSKNNKEFASIVQINADTRNVQFIFEQKEFKQAVPLLVEGKQEQKKHEIPSSYRGQELDKEQLDKLENNQAAFIKLEDKQGKPYQGYITFNKETGKFDFSWPNHKKEQAVPAEANKTQVAVNSEGKTNESTKKINEPLDSKQNKPKNQKQQEAAAAPQKSKAPKL